MSYFYGWLDDKIGTIKTCIILAVLYVVMLFALYLGSADRMIFIYIAVVGMASMTGGTPHMHPSSLMSVFGAKEYQNANRYIAIGIALISSYAIQLMSNILDMTGSLDMGYIVFAVLSAVAAVCLILTNKDELPKEEK